MDHPPHTITYHIFKDADTIPIAEMVGKTVRLKSTVNIPGHDRTMYGRIQYAIDHGRQHPRDSLLVQWRANLESQHRHGAMTADSSTPAYDLEYLDRTVNPPQSSNLSAIVEEIRAVTETEYDAIQTRIAAEREAARLRAEQEASDRELAERLQAEDQQQVSNANVHIPILRSTSVSPIRTRENQQCNCYQCRIDRTDIGHVMEYDERCMCGYCARIRHNRQNPRNETEEDRRYSRIPTDLLDPISDRNEIIYRICVEFERKQTAITNSDLEDNGFIYEVPMPLHPNSVNYYRMPVCRSDYWVSGNEDGGLIYRPYREHRKKPVGYLERYNIRDDTVRVIWFIGPDEVVRIHRAQEVEIAFKVRLYVR
jgi:hypothetical protein